MNNEVLRRSRENLRSHLNSIVVRIQEAEKQGRECAYGWGVASELNDAELLVRNVIETLDELIAEGKA